MLRANVWALLRCIRLCVARVREPQTRRSIRYPVSLVVFAQKQLKMLKFTLTVFKDESVSRK